MRKHDMKRLRILHLLVALVVMSGLFFNITPTTHGFDAHSFTTTNALIRAIDKPQWRIGYNFTFNCPAAFREKEAELKEMIIKSMQIWLEPLRERYPDRQFTDDFLLVRMPDIETCADGGLDDHLLFLLGKVDARIVFDCAGGTSFANFGANETVPGVCMLTDLNAAKIIAAKAGNRMDLIMKSIFDILVHEVGHTFGLGDTYATGFFVSTGGLASTRGKQPSSVMAGISAFGQIEEDDKNCIIWLYKRLYEDHPNNDCFFPDYVNIRPGFCEPKYPLIFEAKHGFSPTVEQILHDDPTLALNAQDREGMTALHHAVARADLKMVKSLLGRQGIKVNIMNKYRQTPAQLGLKLHQKHLVKMINAHPSSKWPLIAWDVAPKGKLTTTWGHLKKRY